MCEPAAARGARRRTPILLGLLAVLVTLLPMLVPAEATAAVRSWPGRSITYVDLSRDPGAVRRAVAAWNRSGIAIRFVRTTDVRTAQLVIRNSRDVPGGCGTGRATLGWPGPGRQAELHILHAAMPTRPACSWAAQTLVVAHELGHVLGLSHDDTRCTLMNSSNVEGSAARRCWGPQTGANARRRLATWRCRILEPIDVRRAVARYGGTPRAVRSDPWCALYTPLAAPTMSGAWDDAAQGVRLQLVRPADQPIPGFLQDKANLYSHFELQRSVGACPSTPASFDVPPEDPPFRQWQIGIEPGMAQELVETGLTPGSWCFSAWARDALGKPGAGPASVTITVPGNT